MSEPTVEDEFLAAHALLDQTFAQADAQEHDGLMRYAWAIREAFLAGVRWERQRTKDDTDIDDYRCPE